MTLRQFHQAMDHASRMMMDESRSRAIELRAAMSDRDSFEKFIKGFDRE